MVDNEIRGPTRSGRGGGGGGEESKKGGAVGTQDHGGLREPGRISNQGGGGRIKATKKRRTTRTRRATRSRGDQWDLGNHNIMEDYENQGNRKIKGDQ